MILLSNEQHSKWYIPTSLAECKFQRKWCGSLWHHERPAIRPGAPIVGFSLRWIFLLCATGPIGLIRAGKSWGRAANSKNNYGVGLGSTIDNSTLQHWGQKIPRNPKNSIHEFSHIAIISSQLVIVQCYIPPMPQCNFQRKCCRAWGLGSSRRPSGRLLQKCAPTPETSPYTRQSLRRI